VFNVGHVSLHIGLFLHLVEYVFIRSLFLQNIWSSTCIHSFIRFNAMASRNDW